MTAGTSGRSPRRLVGFRLVKAVHGLRDAAPDPQFELDLAADLRTRLDREQLVEAFARFSAGSGYIDLLMRRGSLRALVKKLGSGGMIGRHARVMPPPTFNKGARAFVGV